MTWMSSKLSQEVNDVVLATSWDTCTKNVPTKMLALVGHKQGLQEMALMVHVLQAYQRQGHVAGLALVDRPLCTSIMCLFVYLFIRLHCVTYMFVIYVHRNNVFVIYIELYCYLTEYHVYCICDMPINVVDVCYECVICNDISVQMCLQCVITIYVIVMHFIQ